MSLRHKIENTLTLVEGYCRKVENKLNYFQVIPITVVTMVSFFIQFGDLLHSPYTRLDLKLTANNKVVEKVTSANIDMDWSWVTAYFKTMVDATAIYEWTTKWSKVVRGEFYIGIVDSNNIEPRYCKRDETTNTLLYFGGGGYGKDYNNFLLWNCGSSELLNTLNYKPGQLGTFWSPDAYKNIELQDMDIITVRLECDGVTGNLSYIHNNIDLGVAFNNIDLRRRWSLAVVLFRVGEKMILKEFQQISDTQLYFK
eukprot:292379_1